MSDRQGFFAKLTGRKSREPETQARADTRDGLIYPGRALFADRSHAPYQLLKHLPPGIMLDIGAAAGHTTAMMLRGSPRSTIHAFEPFPGNERYFHETIKGDPRVTLHHSAISNEVGKASFWVPKEVSGSEAGWQDFEGYSSLGMLMEEEKEDGVSIQVPTETIDGLGFDNLRFVKIDTQGAELSVLQGANRMLSEHRIDMLFVEFDGYDPVMESLTSAGYKIVDTECTLVNRWNVDLGRDWDIIRRGKLSTGEQTLVAWRKKPVTDPAEYCQMLREERGRLGRAWTDILCVSPEFWDTFVHGAMVFDSMTPTDKQISMRDPISKLL